LIRGGTPPERASETTQIATAADDRDFAFSAVEPINVTTIDNGPTLDTAGGRPSDLSRFRGFPAELRIVISATDVAVTPRRHLTSADELVVRVRSQLAEDLMLSVNEPATAYSHRLSFSTGAGGPGMEFWKWSYP
jgi:hypothetical protein